MRTFARTVGTQTEVRHIDLAGTRLTIASGPGDARAEDFPDAIRARAAHDARVGEWLQAGFVETPVPLRQALEAALVENPDDRAAHAAYADHLTELGDPRGEFVAVQLALEDDARPADERRRLRDRERHLLAQHAREWLGDAGRFLAGDWTGEGRPFDYRFARGWPDAIRVLPFPDAVFPALARSPEMRLLRTLDVVYDTRYHPFEFDLAGPNAALRPGESPGETYEEADILPPLVASPYLTNLRALRLGFSDAGPQLGHSTMVGTFNATTAQQVIDLLARCPRVEELYLNTALAGIDALFALPTLGRLRVLQYYYGTAYTAMGGQEEPYPLSYLADNPSLTRLTTLRLHPGRDATIDLNELDVLLNSSHLPSLEHLHVHMTTFGDEGCRRVVDSGILKRLKTLDLGYGTMTDAGARILAASPDLKRLTVLDVSRNALTTAGVAALARTGVRVVADEQHDPDDTDFLYEVDFE